MTLVRLIVCLSIALLNSVCWALGPSGAGVGPLQFDALIRLDPPLARTHMLLFARYWVATNYYEMVIVWGEPMGSGLRFPVFPTSLRIGSDASSFETRHDLFPVYNTNFTKPVGPSGIFQCMYGDYPIVNLRFSDNESFGERVFVRDLAGRAGIGSTGGESYTLGNSERDRIVQKLEASGDAAHLTSLELFGKDNQPLKSVQYEYKGDGANSRLARETVILPERPIELGLQGEGVLVKSEAGSQRYKDFSGILEKGGRKCVIEYQRTSLGGARINLPSVVEVRDDSHGTALRSVRFSNYQLTKMNRSEARTAAAEFGGLTPDLLKENELSRKYDGGLVKVSDAADLAALHSLRSRLNSVKEHHSPSRELRRVGALRQINELLADEMEIEHLFEYYLALLNQNGLHDVVLWGGAEAIETEAIRGRFSLAERMLSRWLDLAGQNPDKNVTLRFARLCLQNQLVCETVRLLEKLETSDNLTVELRFELEGLKYLACAKLLKTLQGGEPGRVGRSSDLAWNKQLMDADHLKQERDESLAKAKVLYKSGTRFTELQQGLHADLLRLAPE